MDKWIANAQKLRYLWYLLLGLAVAAGFDFRTPKKQFAELRTDAAKMQSDLDSLEAEADDLRRVELFYLYGLTATSCQLLGRDRWADSPLPCRQIVDDKIMPLKNLPALPR